MIAWGDVYKVVEAMAPLYAALTLGYGSVRWWRFFTPEQCAAIHCLVVYFVVPFFTFEFTIHIDPFAMNFRVIAADAISKLATVLLLAAWCRCSDRSSYGWAVTIFSLAQLTNTLVVGAPLFDAMYGRWAQDIIVQLSVAQSILWTTLFLFALELMRARSGAGAGSGGTGSSSMAVADEPRATTKDVECNCNAETEIVAHASHVSLMKMVLFKLAVNPNVYASILGVTWSLMAKRWHFEMPRILENSVMVMSKAGTGLSMFSLGLFMALQEKMISCGPKQALFGMVVKFMFGPAVAAVGAFAVRLHGDLLRVAIIQNALPQSIMSFIFAREYGLHADVTSTGVIFGTIISLPVLIAYYVVLGFLS
ncbi:hypothetical protein Cni_G24925 [Canna indica]|uniref:Auxin efflux carrier component n=1 Tax=Canna indica TaxID=4628 RepID=A0AAQ3KW90_9LILI|nr:hypothetical protein Cni_G24925 [Canna indica]